MKVSICTLFPELYTAFLRTSLVDRAQKKGCASVNVKNIFSYIEDGKRIDSPTFAHNSGMLIKPTVIESVVDELAPEKEGRCTIFFSPKGRCLDQSMVRKIVDQSLSGKDILLFPARYEGMDARVEYEYADFVVSVGDFVLMGGDLPAMMLLEAMFRLLPGVVGKSESVERDSFYGPLLDYAEYTHPVVWRGHIVPEVLRSGNHKQIENYREKCALRDTMNKRFEWFRSHPESRRYISQVLDEVPPHYAALYHTNVMTASEECGGTTSVTSLDIHDIARSAKTFGFCGFHIVTPLLDQQKIVQVLLDYWQNGRGVAYNQSRHKALEHVYLSASHEVVLDHIESIHKKKPLVIGTSARKVFDVPSITYHDQARIFQEQRPVLFAFGTGQGLHPSFLKQCDYVLIPVDGLTNYNHLSVRSAAAIVFDRWLGLNPR